MSCDTDIGGLGAILRVIYWLCMCCYVVGAERKTERASESERNRGAMTNHTSSSWTGRQAGSQVARQARGLNTYSLS